MTVRNKIYLLISFCIGVTSSILMPREKEVVIQKVYIPIAIQTEVFSEQNLKAYIKELKIKYGDIVLAQAKLESGMFTSPLFCDNHNLFGLKPAEKRPTTASGVNRNHADYKNWKKSVLDYALMQSYILAKVKTRKGYIDYIAKNYAELEDREYIRRLNQHLENE